ncbi:MAG TPA: response regulator [Vicinamibacterales bacterium]|nr:response regulator [Vicinamibacterales bacterium]
MRDAVAPRKNPRSPCCFSMNGKRSLTVLVVDDETLLRWSIAELLRRGGHTVLEAASAESARGALNRAAQRLDVILLDYRLPDAHDLTFFEEVRRTVPRSAVILMTAFATPEMTRAALERGAYCVLTKPFEMRGFEDLVMAACRPSRYH